MDLLKRVQSSASDMDDLEKQMRNIDSESTGSLSSRSGRFKAKKLPRRSSRAKHSNFNSGNSSVNSARAKQPTTSSSTKTPRAKSLKPESSRRYSNNNPASSDGSDTDTTESLSSRNAKGKSKSKAKKSPKSQKATKKTPHSPKGSKGRNVRPKRSKQNSDSDISSPFSCFELDECVCNPFGYFFTLFTNVSTTAESLDGDYKTRSVSDETDHPKSSSGNGSQSQNNSLVADDCSYATRSVDGSNESSSQFSYSTNGDQTFQTRSFETFATRETEKLSSDDTKKGLSYSSSDQSYSTRGDLSGIHSDSMDSYVTHSTMGNTTAVSCSDTYLTESPTPAVSTFGRRRMPVSPKPFMYENEENSTRSIEQSQPSHRNFVSRGGREQNDVSPEDSMSSRAHFNPPNRSSSSTNTPKSIKSTGAMRSFKKDKYSLGNTMVRSESGTRFHKSPKSAQKPIKAKVTKSKENKSAEITRLNRTTKSALKGSKYGSEDSFRFGKVHVDYSNDALLKNINTQKKMKVREVKAKSLNYDTAPAPLYRAIDTKQWKQAAIRLQSHPEEAQIWVYRLDKKKEIVWKFLPLHAACFSGAPVELVRALVKSYPNAVRMAAYGDKLPIHIACETGCSRDIVLSLVDAYPDSLCITECNGNTPLELCKNGSNKNKTQLVKMLTQPTKRVVAPKNRFGLFNKRK